MAKLVFGMNVSLDGYIDHEKFAPAPALFRHWIEYERELAGGLYGRGKPFFAGPRPPLLLVANDRLSENTVRLTHVPA